MEHDASEWDVDAGFGSISEWVCKHLYYHLFSCSFLCDLLHPIFLEISGDPYMFKKNAIFCQ
jgi:hypothetical protein